MHSFKLHRLYEQILDISCWLVKDLGRSDLYTLREKGGNKVGEGKHIIY